MIARLSAKMLLLAAAMALVFFGIGLLGFALAGALAPTLGVPLGDALAGALFLLPPLIWAIVLLSSRPAKPAPVSSGSREIIGAIFAALAKETPWIAVVGAGLAGVADLFLNRNKKPK